MPLSTVGSLPNMDSAARASRGSMAVLSCSPAISRFSSAASNGSSRPKTIATSGNSTVKLSSPQNLGLLGPICWRNVSTTKAHVEVLFYLEFISISNYSIKYAHSIIITVLRFTNTS